MIETPKNLTRNILLGMFLGFLIGSFLYYSNFIPDTLLNFIKIYVFNLGSGIFINLLKLLIVPLVFFSLVSGISSLTSMQSLGNITIKTIVLYLSTTAIAVSLSLLIGSVFKPGAGYSSEVAPPEKLPQGQGIYETILDIFPSNIIDAHHPTDRPFQVCRDAWHHRLCSPLKTIQFVTCAKVNLPSFNVPNIAGIVVS